MFSDKLLRAFVYTTFFLPCAAICKVPEVLNNNPFSPWYLADANTGWHFDAFIGVESEPTYAGSDDNETELDGDARAFYRTTMGHRWFLSVGEVGGIYALSDHTQVIAFLEYEEAREADEAPELRLLDEVESTLEGQLGVFHRWGTTYAGLVLQPDLLDRGKGFVWFVAAGKDWQIGDNTRLSISADLSGADSTHMRTEFGITEAEALRSGYPAYRPESGLKSASLAVRSEYRWNSDWSVLLSVEMEHYLSEASDSPLLADEGADNTFELGLSLRYQF